MTTVVAFVAGVFIGAGVGFIAATFVLNPWRGFWQ